MLRRLSRWRSHLAVMAVVLITVGVAQTGLGRKALAESGLFQTPVGLTSLSFLRPTALPLAMSSGHSHLEISFAVTNTAAVARSYEWTVVLVKGNRILPVARGNARVQSRGSVDIARTARITCRHGRIEIRVALQNPAESIDAWVTCATNEAG